MGRQRRGGRLARGDLRERRQTPSRALRLGRRELTFLERLAGAHLSSDPPILATVSGVASTTTDMLDWFARTTDVEVLTTKSIQPSANPGNREPVITEPQPGSFGNAVGLRNPGVAVAEQQFAALSAARARWPEARFLLISIAATDDHSFAELAVRLAAYADAIELNLSCPHAHGGYGSAIGCDPNLVRSVTTAVVRALSDSGNGHLPVIAKLTPNVERIGAVATEAIAAGAAGVTAINTVGPYQYREPHSGGVILTNPAPAHAGSEAEREALRGRGGRSGEWVHERALEAVAEVREAIGSDPVVIGMGGVASAEAVSAMRSAGADAVGVGSALALYPQREWPALLRALRSPAFGELGTGRPSATGAPTARRSAGMTFRPYTVRERRELGAEMVEIELAGSLPFEAGQSVFVWIPEVGEKPYSPALGDPATFLIRRRGPHTRAFAAVQGGDTLYVRGPYGDGAGVISSSVVTTEGAPSAAGSVHIIVAGSGTALAPRLAATLATAAAEVHTWLALRDEVETVPLRAAIEEHSHLHAIRDEGVVGRAISRFEEHAREGRPSSVWVVGPDPFMKLAVAAAGRAGVREDAIHLSLEQRMMCGVGLCGLCSNAGVLTCSNGTFVRADEWSTEEP